MNRVLIIYKSNTGFTKKYVDWIQEDLVCDSLSSDEVTLNDIKNHDIIAFGGGMHANKINGIKFLTTYEDILKNKILIIFATGATPLEAKLEIEGFKKNNMPQNRNVPFFYFRSGMNYGEMKTSDKIIMNLYKAVLKIKPKKSINEMGTKETIINSCDYTDKKYIKPFIEYIHKCL